MTLPIRSKQPARKGGRLIRQLVGVCLAVPLALIGFVGCTAPADRVRINQAQVIGTHNSYHLRGHESLHKLIAKYSAGLAEELDYAHRPLTEQLSRLGIRQIELDCFADPQGGLYAEPRGPKLAAALGLPPVPDHDPEHRLAAPG